MLHGDEWREEGSIFHLPHRQMWFRRVGDVNANEALQFSKRTWYKCSSKKGFEILKEHCGLGPFNRAYLHLAEGLQLMFPDWKSKDHRDLGLMYMRAHAYEHAIECFNLALEAKRTPLDVWIYKGDALLSKGDAAGAQILWEDCLTRVRSQASAIAQLCRSRLSQFTSENPNEED